MTSHRLPCTADSPYSYPLLPRPPAPLYLPCTKAPTLSFRLVSAPALMSDSAHSVCSFVTAQCSAVHMDCRDAAAASAQHTR